MKKLFLIFLLSFPLFSVGQNWSPQGATWYYGFSVYVTEGYYKITYVGDTTINSIQCKKLLKTVYTHDFINQLYDTIVIGAEYTYADNDKVYIYKHNQFYTLYDFSAEVGDTWNVPEIKHYDGCDTVGTIRVDSIGTLTIDGQALRYICVSLNDTAQKWGWIAKIVEIVGPIKSLKYQQYPYDYLFPVKFDDCGMHLEELIEGGNFRCYSDSTNFSYTSNITPTCDFLTSVNPIDKNPVQIRVLPNPSNGSFTIDIDQQLKLKEIIVSTMLGNIILRQQTDNQTRIKIDNLKGGTYILTAIDKDNRTINKTIISLP